MSDNRTADELWHKYHKMNWDHEYAENGIVNKRDCFKIVSQQTASLREENDKMCDLLTESQEETDSWKNKALELQEEVERLRGVITHPCIDFDIHALKGGNVKVLTRRRLVNLLESIKSLSSKESKPS